MRFTYKCRLVLNKTTYNAIGSDFAIANVLVTDDVNITSEERYHTFVVVVNKKGQLTTLCIN